MFEPQTIAYQELRAFWAELLIAPDDMARQHIINAAQLYLKLHCASCGSLIDEFLRRRDPPEELCLACITPPPPPEPAVARRTTKPADHDDVPF